jgi:hypothetical protein
MAARLGACSQQADLDISFGTVQLVGSVRMTATVAFGGVRGVNLSGDFPFSAVCDAEENVLVRMTVCHLGDLSGGFGFGTRSMIVIVLRLGLCCSRVCALGLTLECETHIISLIRVDAVPCAC